MPTPKEAFDNPGSCWAFLTASTDDEFEGQYFDRKEAGQSGRSTPMSSSEFRSVREIVIETVSAFANENRAGGLLVIGISKHGEVKGVGHLTEEQINALSNLNDVLKNHAASCHGYDHVDDAGKTSKVLLVYVPYTSNGICETVGNLPRAWRRSGSQNLPLNDQARDQMKRDKRIVDFERSYCCPFLAADLDTQVVAEFRKSFLADSTQTFSDEELLLRAGAIVRDGKDLTFTNAGWLFFAARPQRELAWAYTRLLRFEVESKTSQNRGLPSFDRSFDGPIPQQIRLLRVFFRESGFFKIYQRRKQEGGFIDDPEFPPIAIDEAIVNAVAHRDYGIQLPLECVYYRDSFLVENPGRVIQRDQDLPPEFSLADTVLTSMPRNPKIVEWLKVIHDEQGAAFVRAISEGTKRMQGEMISAGLPSPRYHSNHARTVITLFNNAAEREARAKAALSSSSVSTFSNLYRIHSVDRSGKNADGPSSIAVKDLNSLLADALRAKGWYIDSVRFGRVVAHRQGLSLPAPAPVGRFLQFFPAYSFHFLQCWGVLYLSVDYVLQVKNVRNVNQLLADLAPADLASKSAVAKVSSWQRGRILEAGVETTRVRLFDFEGDEVVASDKVIPDLPLGILRDEMRKAHVDFDLAKEVKRHSLGLDPSASRTRAEKISNTVRMLAEEAFPLRVGDATINMDVNPEPLVEPGTEGRLFANLIAEPSVEFNKGKETPDIRDGITKFGAYEDSRKNVEIVPICTEPMRANMARLIERLKVGKYRYHGAERTFSTKLSYNSIVTVQSPEDTLAECQRLLGEHPEWIGAASLDRLFLVFTPEHDHSLDDETAPYFRVKRYLLEQGIPCQMVDMPTLLDPDWKDLNLALNIVAKCGVTPWVLPNKIPDADFFVGLSYTQSRKAGSQRLIGYATVFNQFGRWEFYSGNTEAFSYEERSKYFGLLVESTLKRLSLQDNPTIYFHYSAKFSKEDRTAILRAARSVRPRGTYSFVSINSHHNIRLFDNRPDTDGSLRRGSYIAMSPYRIMISTTGYNPFRKSLGTPLPLEVTTWIEAPEGAARNAPDLRALAVQILSLTKLNWASTDALCAEPITTKFAGDIAYLTDAFLRQAVSFHLHPALENTPWFI